MDQLDSQLQRSLKTAMREACMSQTKVAAEAGIPKSTMTWKMSKPSSFTLDEFRRIAEAVNLPMAYLLTAQDAA